MRETRTACRNIWKAKTS